ncbi:hypothetical protein CEP48_03790 [Mergibacter septicus]|uniref:LPS-assembly lipoprotein LptE n=1 Tax=Mergibacter septicus TaxID=221402 RepID=A0A8E3MG80_9PAST|nr:LPS assembly lipoprotein LptE [Mergibacter septicus]AWX15339.1 hypothetical protein CEP47_03790 [Mergibacter septicus]QDJ14593.1 hypothetical protein CEP48_03790 [Mergibacter septicus]UTU47973.1 hypothetical protein HLL31_03815 [Mergibacter septicus]WMR96420.1 LPS assembly lipoprotein LptE [Mergibacter septicus]
MKYLRSCLLLMLTISLSACGFHFENQSELAQKLQHLHLESNDPYADMTVAMRQELKRHQLLVNENQVKDSTAPILRINSVQTNSQVASVFQQGRAAETILSLTVNAVLIINNQRYPIQVKSNRVFFDNPREALAKNTEKSAISQALYQQAAQQIWLKLLTIQKQLN